MLGGPWATSELLYQLIDAAPRAVRAWAHREMARELEATGHPVHALSHLLDAQALAPDRATAGAVARVAPHADALRVAHVSATPPRPWTPPATTLRTETIRRWQLPSAVAELRLIIDVECSIEPPSLVLVARPADGSPEVELAHVGSEYANAGNSWWTTVRRGRVRSVEGRPQLVLEGDVTYSTCETCEYVEGRDVFMMVCETPAPDRVGGCVRIDRGVTFSRGRLQRSPERPCVEGMSFPRRPVARDPGTVEVGARGVRWRGAASLPWLRRWRSLDELRSGAPEQPRHLARPTHLDGSLPPRVPLEPPPTPTPIQKHEAGRSSDDNFEAVELFERLFPRQSNASPTESPPSTPFGDRRARSAALLTVAGGDRPSWWRPAGARRARRL